MIALSIREEKIAPILERLGYKPHPKGHNHGYIKTRGRGERWHAYWHENNLQIHLDVTIGGKHKVARLMGILEEEHKQEILRMKLRMKEEREALERANTKMSKKKLNRLKYKAVLPREELLKALAKIKITP